ncbi:MAG TPA: class I SAM-dependent methyltransferase [Alphaproteobacteria bacterium]|nr:class I SAM-dependent methyltransferase [Alphaproteobacteria bacterium]
MAGKLAARFGVSFDIRGGVAEDIPFPDDHFDVVIATSVMEHVTDLEQSLSEVHRVLKPGGIFWFNSASAMRPAQDEIRGFPLFGWYPDIVKKRIMMWVKDHRPHLVGHTAVPALHWWTNRRARNCLRDGGSRARGPAGICAFPKRAARGRRASSMS